MSEAVITPEDLEAAVAAAVATAVAEAQATAEAEAKTLRDELDALRQKDAQTEVGQAVAEAVAPFETQVAELQTKLDETEARATAAEQAIADATAYAEALATADEDFVAYCERITARDAAMKEAGIFSDEYVAENLERFVAMDDDQFVPYLADLTAAQGGKPKGRLPRTTSMTASADSDTSARNGKSALSYIGAMREAGQDPRTI